MNLREVLTGLGIRYVEGGSHPLVTSGWIGIVCPYCDRGRGNPGLGVQVRTLKTSCWRCGPHGLAAALAEASGRRPAEVRALLGELPTVAQEAAPPPGKLELPAGLGPLEPVHRRYLEKRGFDPDELAERWGVQGIGLLGGKLAWRIFLPLRDQTGRTVSWTTRAIGNVPHGERYRGAKREQSLVPRGDCLGGIEHVRHAAVVCEGMFDSAWVGPGAVWTAGVGYSRGQIAALAEIPVRAILFDREPAAQRRAHALAARLSVFSGETYVIETSGPDPATSPRAEAAEIRARFLA